MEKNEQLAAYDEAINYLKTSPMFNLSLSSNELFHSNFLYWIWKTNEDCFKKIINSLIGEENYWDNNWGGKQLAVRREYKNFDLSIVEVLNSSKTDDDSDNKVNQITSEPENGKYSTDGLILFVLENKVKSIPYAQQLLKYNEKIKNHNEVILKKEILKERQLKKWTKNNDLKEELDKRINNSTCKKVLLSLTDAYPDIQLDNGYFEEWKKISYDEYLSNLKEADKSSNTATCEVWNKFSNIFEDYQVYVSNLISCIKEWDKFPDLKIGENCFLDSPHLQTAEELRLHALYSKYNYAKLCCILMQKLNATKCAKGKVQYIRKQDDIMLLTGHDPKKKSQFKCYKDCFGEGVLIGVGYDYTNMKPLLEVKVVKESADKLIYIIQVQGDKYAHGIIKKGVRSEVESFITCNELPEKWVDKIEGCNEIFGNNEVNDSYNGYNDTYSMVYKYRQITDKAKTEDVINYMFEDVKKLLKELDKQQ